MLRRRSQVGWAVVVVVLVDVVVDEVEVVLGVRPHAVGVDADGELYILSYSRGRILKLVPPPQ